MADVLWKECAEWLIRCRVLPPDHRVKWRNAQVIDLANTLRDGVLLCYTLNNLIPGCIDLKEINLRPQMSQFLCLKNIRAFLHACPRFFDLRSSDLFEPHMLFDYTDFGRVLNTLSKLSNSPKAFRTGIRGFPSYGARSPDHDYYNDDIYRNLEDLAKGPFSGSFSGSQLSNSEDYEECYKYDEINSGILHEEEGIYEDLCSLQKTRFQVPATPQAPVEKRDYCIKELVETEKNYLEVLNRINSNFVRPLKAIIKLEDRKIIFMEIKELSEIHTGFHSELAKANGSASKISDSFLHWKEQFVVYGDYCSNLPRAQELVDELCNKNEAINQIVLQSQMAYNDGKFKLRDLLSVPMQRVLKYHLFLTELKKNTLETHEDYPCLEKALDAMLDLAQYINEVKRDNEALQIIRDIQGSITDLVMPENMELKDYGRLLRDGELKIRCHTENNKLKNRYVFVFDRVMMMCKSTRIMDKLMGGEQYSFKEAIILCEYRIEEVTGRGGRDKWTHYWYLVHQYNTTAYTMYAKTEEMKNKWVESFRTALDNTNPAECSTTDHMFAMYTFCKATSCDNCQKLLSGAFYQGYYCSTCGIAVHKKCIATVRSCGAPSLPPRPATDDNNHVNYLVQALSKRSYNNPQPGYISFDANDIIYVLAKTGPIYWEGRVKKTGHEGLFPADFVEEVGKTSRESYMEGILLRPIPPPPALKPAQSPCDPYVNLSLEEYNWFAGRMSHDDANAVLDKLPNGAFLVRVSERSSGRFAISIKHDNKVKHMRVCTSEDGEFYYLSDSKNFKSIVELVRWYEENTLAESFNGLDTTLTRPYKMTNAALTNAPDPIGYAVANYDFSATASTMLSLRQGDRLAILSKRGGDRGWWKGRIADRIGYFPLAYVTEESSEEPPKL